MRPVVHRCAFFMGINLRIHQDGEFLFFSQPIPDLNIQSHSKFRQLSAESLDSLDQLSPDERIAFVDRVAANNVVNVVNEIMKRSSTLVSLVDQKKIGIVGAMYDVSSGNVAGIREAVRGLDPDDVDRILNND